MHWGIVLLGLAVCFVVSELWAAVQKGAEVGMQPLSTGVWLMTWRAVWTHNASWRAHGAQWEQGGQAEVDWEVWGVVVVVVGDGGAGRSRLLSRRCGSTSTIARRLANRFPRL